MWLDAFLFASRTCRWSGYLLAASPVVSWWTTWQPRLPRKRRKALRGLLSLRYAFGGVSLCGCIGGVPLLGYQDLSKWLPRWYIESCGCAAEPDSDDDVARSDRQKSSKCLTMLEWGIAFDHFSIAADAAGMWHYWESRAHLANCHKVAGMCLSLDMFLWFCVLGCFRSSCGNK